jgi:hypothetical protein
MTLSLPNGQSILLRIGRCNHQSRVKPTMPGTSNLIFLGVGQWGQFFIVHKPYKNMLNVGYRSVSQERRRLKDRLSDDRNAQELFK